MDTSLSSKVRALKAHHEHLHYLHCVAYEELVNSLRALEEEQVRARRSNSRIPVDAIERYETAIEMEKQSREAMAGAYDSWSEALCQLAGVVAA